MLMLHVHVRVAMALPLTSGKIDTDELSAQRGAADARGQPRHGVKAAVTGP